MFLHRYLTILAAALFQLEKSHTPTNMVQAAAVLVGWLQAPEQTRVHRAFAVWIRRILHTSIVPAKNRMPMQVKPQVLSVDDIHFRIPPTCTPTMRFLDVRTDFAFKKVFGSQHSKPVLIDFLNAMLEYEGSYAIADLEIVDPYQIPLIQGMKDTFVDVKAVLANGKQVIIEMQVLNVEGLEQRILYNAAKQYSTQLYKGEHYRLLNPVIALTFTDFVLFKDEQEQVISRFKLLEKQRLVEYSDDIELIFVELPKFTLALEQLENVQQQWIYFVKNAGDLKFIPERLNTPRIHQAFDMINEAGMSAEELEQQHKRREFIFMQRDALEKAQADGWAKGHAEGNAEGNAKGNAKGKAEALQKLLHKRFGTLSAEILHRITTASVAQIDDWLDRVLDAATLEEVFHEARH